MTPTAPRPTKAERRQAAREKARALREEQERQARRAAMTRRGLIAGGIVAVAGAGAAVVLSQGKDTPVVSSTETVPAGDGIPQGVKADGSWTYGADLTVGSETPGAKTLEVFFDYSCHHCANFDVLHHKEIVELLSAGKLTLVLHPCKLLGMEWTDDVMNSLGVVFAKQPEKVLDMHQAVMARFAEIFQKRDADALTVDTIVKVAQSVGVRSDVTEIFASSVSEHSFKAWVEAGTATFQDRGLNSTPTVFLDGTQLDLRTLAGADSLTALIG